jgi:hypothetical protein
MRRRRRPLGTAELFEILRSVRDSALALEEVCRRERALVGEDDRPSARTLVHYLGVRQGDAAERGGSRSDGRQRAGRRRDGHGADQLCARRPECVADDGKDRSRGRPSPRTSSARDLRPRRAEAAYRFAWRWAASCAHPPFRTVDGRVQHEARVRFQGSAADPMIPSGSGRRGMAPPRQRPTVRPT